MAKSTSYPVCKKKFTSSSHHKSVVTLESNHLVFCVDQQFIERKIYYRKSIQPKFNGSIAYFFYFGSYFVDASIYLSGFESNGDLPVSCFEFYFDVYFSDLYSPLWEVFICGACQSNGCRHLCFLYQ